MVDKRAESVAEHAEDFLTVGWYPVGHAGVRVSSYRADTVEEFPLVWSKHAWEHALDEVQAVGQPVGLEKRTADLRVAQPDQTVAQLFELLLDVGSLGLGLEGAVEKLDEAREGELIHVVHLEQVAEDHKEVAANH